MLRKTETLRAFQCGHPKYGLCIQHIELPGPSTLLKDGGAHFFEHVDNVIAGHTVGPETNGNAGSPDFIQACDAVAKLRIGFRAMDDRRPSLAKNVEIRIFEIDSVNQKHFRTQ